MFCGHMVLCKSTCYHESINSICLISDLTWRGSGLLTSIKFIASSLANIFDQYLSTCLAGEGVEK